MSNEVMKLKDYPHATELIEYYASLSTKLGNVIPPDRVIAQQRKLPTTELLSEVRAELRHLYTYRWHMDDSWVVVFVDYSGLQQKRKTSKQTQSRLVAAKDNPELEAALNQFKADYKEYMLSADVSTDEAYAEAKQNALVYALHGKPELEKAYWAFNEWHGRNIRNGRYNHMPTEAKTELERLGNRITVRMAHACKGLRKQKPADKAAKETQPQATMKEALEKPKQRLSIAALYREWCANNTFVSHDQLLAFFNGDITPGAFAKARAALVEEGYEFFRLQNGWQVIKPKRLEDMNAEELRAYIRRLEKRDE